MPRYGVACPSPAVLTHSRIGVRTTAVASRLLLVRRACWIAASITLIVAPLPAQIVQGSVLDRETAAPVRGAVILGMRESGALPIRISPMTIRTLPMRASPRGVFT